MALKTGKQPVTQLESFALTTQPLQENSPLVFPHSAAVAQLYS